MGIIPIFFLLLRFILDLVPHLAQSRDNSVDSCRVQLNPRPVCLLHKGQRHRKRLERLRPLPKSTKRSRQGLLEIQRQDAGSAQPATPAERHNTPALPTHNLRQSIHKKAAPHKGGTTQTTVNGMPRAKNSCPSNPMGEHTCRHAHV